MTNHPIAVFYHCLFVGGDIPHLLPAAPSIIAYQMYALESRGLLDASETMICGINGGTESHCLAAALLPEHSIKVFHGLESRSENFTISVLEDWCQRNKDHYVFYEHSKGATHPPNSIKSTIWRNCMTRNLVTNWRRCVEDLDSGYEVVGCHYMRPPLTPEGQHIFAGNFFWAKANYLATLPRLRDRARIKMSGMGALESRYESEVWLMGGKNIPRLKDYHGPHWHPGQIASCE